MKKLVITFLLLAIQCDLLSSQEQCNQFIFDLTAFIKQRNINSDKTKITQLRKRILNNLDNINDNIQLSNKRKHFFIANYAHIVALSDQPEHQQKINSIIFSKENSKSFDGWAISKELFNYISKILPANKTILELGSGWGTQQLSTKYKMFSVEHDSNWVNKYKSTYIHAPIANGWYDTNILKSHLPKKYDLILIDGPPATVGRYGFYKNLHLFNTNVPMIFDDINREPEYKLMADVSKKLNKPFKIIRSKNSPKYFGVIL